MAFVLIVWLSVGGGSIMTTVGGYPTAEACNTAGRYFADTAVKVIPTAGRAWFCIERPKES